MDGRVTDRIPPVTQRASKLVVGVGQVLKHDDGVGVRAVEVLASLPLPPDVEVFDAGVGGWELADQFMGRELVIIIDAIDAGEEPGAVFRLGPDELRPQHVTGMSLHDLHLLDALEETRLLGAAPGRVVVFAIQEQDVSAGLGLTPAVEAALDRTLRLILRELELPEDLLAKAPRSTSWCS
jgi:hydrogenase maturation protease